MRKDTELQDWNETWKFCLSTLAPSSMRECPQVAPEMQSSLLCFEEMQMRTFHSFLWKCLLQTQHWTCAILHENIKASPPPPPIYCYYQKCHQVTQFLHSNVIFSRCQIKKVSLWSWAENKSLHMPPLFICTTHGGQEWHLASLCLSLEDDIWLYPKIVMFQPKDESAFSRPKKIRTVPKLSS